MKKNPLRRRTFLLALALVFTGALAGCGQPDDDGGRAGASSATVVTPGAASGNAGGGQEAAAQNSAAATELYVRFGDDGAPFTLHLYENDTAAAIARHMGTADWRLPIYHYDDYENWEVMQYYDIPSRYEIPSNPETVTTEKAGTVYYSEPNRIVLFFGDAEVPAAYTPVGYFAVTDEFISAVKNNPVVEGWSNKLVHISAEQ